MPSARTANGLGSQQHLTFQNFDLSNSAPLLRLFRIRFRSGLTTLDAIDGRLEVRHEYVTVGWRYHEIFAQAFGTFDDDHSMRRMKGIVPAFSAETGFAL